jgi:hypothetical protein
MFLIITYFKIYINCITTIIIIITHTSKKIGRVIISKICLKNTYNIMNSLMKIYFSIKYTSYI